MRKLIIRILFRRISVPVEWIHETVDMLDSDGSGEITLSELVITLRELWRKMRKAKRIAKV